jgi:hypothetical protein
MNDLVSRNRCRGPLPGRCQDEPNDRRWTKPSKVLANDPRDPAVSVRGAERLLNLSNLSKGERIFHTLNNARPVRLSQLKLLIIYIIAIRMEWPTGARSGRPRFDCAPKPDGSISPE